MVAGMDGGFLEGYTEEALRDVVARYESVRVAAMAERDAALRQFAAAGWRQVDLQRVTGYSRETIRVALRPELRDAINADRRELTARRSRRPKYAVVTALDELRGPSSGFLTLPPPIGTPDLEPYDLSNPGRVARCYEARDIPWSHRTVQRFPAAKPDTPGRDLRPD